MKIQYQGREVEGVDVDFLTRKEDFSEYQLTDGKLLRMKTVLTDVYRLEGELNAEGEQVYHVKSLSIVRIRQ